jgi:hypothetical protein
MQRMTLTLLGIAGWRGTPIVLEPAISTGSAITALRVQDQNYAQAE